MLKKARQFFSENYLAITIFVFAVLGFTAAFTLTIDKFDILRNPNQELPCNINPLLNCGIVMRSKYAEVFGIPWSLLGVAGYPAVMLLALFLIQKRKLTLWLTWLITLPAFGAFALSTYFMYVSAYLIGVFCPWCILSAISSTVIFFTLLTINFVENNYQLPEKQVSYLQRKIRQGWNILFVIIWFVLLAIVEYFPFWYANR